MWLEIKQNKYDIQNIVKYKQVTLTTKCLMDVSLTAASSSDKVDRRASVGAIKYTTGANSSKPVDTKTVKLHET
jgi:hypothetical protein